MLSNGDARISTTTSNTAEQKTLNQGSGASSDADLADLSAAAGYSQALYDAVLLTFDITPTVSGLLAFQYVFGSEEYPDFAPSPGGTYVCERQIWGFGFTWHAGTNTACVSEGHLKA